MNVFWTAEDQANEDRDNDSAVTNTATGSISGIQTGTVNGPIDLGEHGELWIGGERIH